MEDRPVSTARSAHPPPPPPTPCGLPKRALRRSSLQHLHQLPQIPPIHHQHIAAVRTNPHRAMRTREAHGVVVDLTALARERVVLVARRQEAVVVAEARQLGSFERACGEDGAGRDRRHRGGVAHWEVGGVAGARGRGRGGRHGPAAEPAAAAAAAALEDVVGLVLRRGCRRRRRRR